MEELRKKNRAHIPKEEALTDDDADEVETEI